MNQYVRKLFVDNLYIFIKGVPTTLFTGFVDRATDLLGIIHTDVCGPMSISTRNGYRYFVTFTDDLCRYGYIYLMKQKSETFEKLKEFQREVKNQLDGKIKHLHSDRGVRFKFQV
jgi:hypothetical protein